MINLNSKPVRSSSEFGSLDDFEGLYGLLPYHIPYLKQFCSEFDVNGKDVLEVGGAMPPEIVIDFLGANSWTCTEAPSYSGNQQAQSSYATYPNQHKIMLTNIEDFGQEYNNSFDCIFSIACFEHIHKFPEALTAMWSVLKPEGKLFSMFSPIWSCHDGHHLYHLSIPERFSGENFPNKIIMPWAHLLESRESLHRRLLADFDRDFADLVVYNVYNSSHINRFFAEDYMYFFQSSRFRLDKFFPTFHVPVPSEVQSMLELKNPSYKLFSNMGFYVFISK